MKPKSRFAYARPQGRRLLLVFPVRLVPEKPKGFPYEAVIAEPARWPATNWQRRLRLARPFRVLAAAIDGAARLFSGPLYRLATDIEGQPLVWWCEMDGWQQKFGWRDGRGCLRWVYEGEVTPAIRQMFADHPERFQDCSPAMLYQLRAGA